MLPNQHGWSRDYSIPEVINSYGFRDREWEPPARRPDPETGGELWVVDDGLFRVAVVGNSITYGTSVHVEDTWARVLEERLRRDFEERGVEREPLVMNFAVQGYVFEQMARVYEDTIRAFRPDLLIVPTIPHDVMEFERGKDAIDFPYRRLLMRTAANDYVTKAVTPWVKKRLEWADPTWGRSPAEEAHLALDVALQHQPFAPEHEFLWEAAAERMADVLRMVECDGGRLVLVNTPPNIETVGIESRRTTTERWLPWVEAQNAAAGEHPRVLHVEPMPDMRLAMANLTREMWALGMEVALPRAHGKRTVNPDLEHVEECLYLLDDVSHFNPRGHRTLGIAIYRQLSQGGFLP